jgi:ribosomal protein L7/L12
MEAADDADAEAVAESFRHRSLRVLYEQEAKKEKPEPKINMDVFTEKIANLIKNYTSLVDVKKNVIDQAESYLKSQFPDHADKLNKQLKNLLSKNYHISLERPEPPPDSYAVGAKGGGGGAA